MNFWYDNEFDTNKNTDYYIIIMLMTKKGKGLSYEDNGYFNIRN